MRDGYKLSNADVKTASDLVAQDALGRSARSFPQGQPDARPASAASRRRRSTSAAISTPSSSTTSSSASARPGTGKTYLAMAQAVAFLVAKKVSRIILARPAVEAGEKLGFLPGDLQEKVNPYLRPLYDALYDMLDVERVARYIERGTIEIAPIAFMRGRTLNDSFVILDEAQNTTSEQMKMFLTRLGFGAKAVITGDITQIDLPTGRTSGPGRGDEGGRRDRGHLVRLLRRSRRRPPQAGAADRQGVRGVLERATASAARRRREPPTRHDSRASQRRARARLRVASRRARPAAARARPRRAGCAARRAGARARTRRASRSSATRGCAR